MEDTKYVNGVKKLGQRVKTIRTALALPVMVNEITDLLLRRTLDRFDREIDPDYVPWEPLADSTLARRRRDGVKSTKKLNRTGAMRGAIKRIRGAAAGLLVTNTGAGARIGVADPAQTKKAAAQQYGTRFIPQRKFLGIGSLDVKSVDSLLRRKAKSLTE